MADANTDPLVVAIATALATCGCCDKVINLDEHWEEVEPFLAALNRLGYHVAPAPHTDGRCRHCQTDPDFPANCDQGCAWARVTRTQMTTDLPDDLEMTPEMERYLAKSFTVTPQMREHARRVADRLERPHG